MQLERFIQITFKAVLFKLCFAESSTRLVLLLAGVAKGLADMLSGAVAAYGTGLLWLLC